MEKAESFLCKAEMLINIL